jgi:transposase
MHGHRPRLLLPHRDWLLSRMAHGKDFTLRGLQAELSERGVKVDYRTVWNFVHAEELSFKKSVLPSEQERPDIARFRARWKKYQGRLDQSDRGPIKNKSGMFHEARLLCMRPYAGQPA